MIFRLLCIQIRPIRSWLSPLALSLLTLVLASSLGCCVNRGGGGCNSCGDPWVINDGGLFDQSAHGSCDQCGEVGCGGHRPLSLLRKVMTCGAGCGNEIYFDEWISDPPDCCDPCSNHGDWVGPTPCGPSFFPLTWRNMFGLRGEGGCGSGDCGSCSTCGPGPVMGPVGDPVGPHYDGQIYQAPKHKGQAPAQEGFQYDGPRYDGPSPQRSPGGEGAPEPPPEMDDERVPRPVPTTTQTDIRRSHQKRPFYLLGARKYE